MAVRRRSGARRPNSTDIVSLAFASLALLSSAVARARPPRAASSSKSSTSSLHIVVSSAAVWKDWLAANYPIKPTLSPKQEKALDAAAADADERVPGSIFKDGVPGAIVVKYSHSKRTLSRLTVLRWSGNGWKPVLRAENAGLFDAKGSPITPVSPVAAYQVYLERQPAEPLRLIVTLGDAGDNLYGDAIGLSYDSKAASYAWPDDSDHD